MSMQGRQEILVNIQSKYKSADWKMKNQLLDGFIAATGYDRKYAIKLLNSEIKKKNEEQKKRGKCPYYNEAVIQVLEMIWHASNQICSKRLVPFLPEFVSSLERHGHLRMNEEIRSRVLSVSPATFDRLLRKERTKVHHGACTTRPGSLLKNQIKIRTFADWNEVQPGFFEADLVAHCGETVMGVFLNTFVITDIVTTWTECISLIKKSADDVIVGLDTASQLLPFKILGFDVDNGCEFINYDLINYCEKMNITLTRARAYRKNDQAHVEEKNGSIVRRLIGYDRYEGEEAWETMCQLYSVLRLYINFFQPSLKLLAKIRQGSKTIKRYDLAKTPYQRVLASEHIEQKVKQDLTHQYHHLDPLVLQKQIRLLQEKLWKLAWKGPIVPIADPLEIKNTEKATDSLSEPVLYRRTKRPSRQQCHLLWIASPPEKDKLNTLPISSNAAYMRHNEKLFYINKRRKECVLLNVTKENLLGFDQTLKANQLKQNKMSKVLNDHELNIITSLTGHSHRKLDWRSRKDPFEGVKDFIDFELQLNPQITAVELLKKLIKNYPADFYKGHLRTLQRRIREIRNEQDQRKQKYQELMINKKSMTTGSFIGTIM